MLLFKVSGMSCEHCVRAVQAEIRKVAPEATVKVDLAAGVVGIEGAAEPQKISEAIAEAGYTVEGQVA